MKQKEVLILFKTHLDVGFTDYSDNIIAKYLNEYIPNAIRVGYALKDTPTPFVWTVGSWLLAMALRHDPDHRVENAIRDGILGWHALPFTTHTELMNTALFRHGLNISKELDRRFGRKTTGAKMTDVPGHTIGMVPLMADSGIEFLHIGVNSATPVPPVPPLFKWRLGEKEITVMYQGAYGAAAEFEDFIVYFAHTNDNCGPQSAEEIIRIYAEAQAKYPGCMLKAATLTDIAQRISQLQNLPVLQQEIGDTWIHGAGTDPQKMSRYRKVLRHLSDCEADTDLILDNLLPVPEHTWGMDVKTFFHNDRDFYPEEMERQKSQRAVIERSWQEQRAYVEKAESVLGITPDYPVAEPNPEGYTEIPAPAELPVEISWQIFNRADYDRYKNTYLRHFLDWAIWDFTKVGLPDDPGGILTPAITHAYQKGDVLLYQLEFPADIAQKYGLPWFWLELRKGTVNLKWFGKRACRLPQACWLKFSGMEENWELHKLGTWIRPSEVVGSPLICAVDEGVRNSQVLILPLDSALVAPYGRRLLHYGCTGLKEDLYFNLYNNIWNTNFPMWYEDDSMFRFEISPRS